MSLFMELLPMYAAIILGNVLILCALHLRFNDAVCKLFQKHGLLTLSPTEGGEPHAST